MLREESGEKRLLKYGTDNLILDCQDGKFKLVLTGKLQSEFDQEESKAPRKQDSRKTAWKCSMRGRLEGGKPVTPLSQ